MESLTDAHIDAEGRRHPVALNARIVSLVPSITELLFSLDLAEQVVGRTTFCIHPAGKVDGVRRIGGTKTVNFERLAALHPTHVIVNIDENRKEDVAALEALGAQVVVTHPKAPQDNLALYRLLGGIFGRGTQAQALGRAFRRELAATRTFKAGRVTHNVLYLIWRKPWMTVARDTYISRTLALAGWMTTPAHTTTRYPEISTDDPCWRQADAVLLSSEPYPFKDKHIEAIQALAGPRTAVRLIDGEMTSWYGSRAIRGLRYLRGFDISSSAQ